MDPIAAYAECYRSVEQLARLGIVSAAAKEQIQGLLPQFARAQYDFAARNEDELTISDGELLLVTARETPDYLHAVAERNGQQAAGLIPASYAQIIDDPSSVLPQIVAKPRPAIPDRSAPRLAPPPHYTAVDRAPPTLDGSGRPAVSQRKVFGVDVDASKAAASVKYSETRNNVTNRAKQLMGKKT